MPEPFFPSPPPIYPTLLSCQEPMSVVCFSNLGDKKHVMSHNHKHQASNEQQGYSQYHEG